MGPTVAMDGCKKSCPYRDSIPGPSSPYPVAIPVHPKVSFKVQTRFTKLDNRQFIIHISEQVYIGICTSTVRFPYTLIHTGLDQDIQGYSK